MTVTSTLEPQTILKYCRKCHAKLMITQNQKFVKCECGQEFGITTPLSDDSKGCAGGIKLYFLRNYRGIRSDSEILDCIRNLSVSSQNKIADELDMNATTLIRVLRRLVDEKKIEIVSQRPGKKTVYRVIDCP